MQTILPCAKRASSHTCRHMRFKRLLWTFRHRPLQPHASRGTFPIVSAVAASAATMGMGWRRREQFQPGMVLQRCLCSSETLPVHTVGAIYEIPGAARCTEHHFRLPLQYTEEKREEQGPEVAVFVRECTLSRNIAKSKDLPVLLFLQGGPGFPAARPASATGGWFGRALEDHRVLLLDQRGTGRSTPVTAQTLQSMPPQEQAKYLACFRADSIVRDCEEIRKSLGIDKLCILGQSFGGFCALTYLSQFPESLSAVYLTGGMAPILRNADEVYRATYRRVLERNRRYYARYPDDVGKVREIVAYLKAFGDVQLPSGGRLTPRRFLSIGLGLGAGGGFEEMHWLVEDAFVEVAGSRQLDFRFLVKFEAMQAFDTNPIFWLLHEAIYCSPDSGASRWAAQRILNEEPFSEAFDFSRALDKAPEEPIMFTGEMVYPWFAEDFAALGIFAEAAELLAAKDDWPALYDVENLRNTRVLVAAAVYYEDMYVEFAFSMEVAALLGDRCKVWVTNEFQHSGVRDDGARVLGTLIKMLKGDVAIPS